ncbi:hypothetical protein B0H10DRAFT_1030783 [Mycena sp. CBHHK59/15]|nr:hypothetical protein B0H10DRAFT_1030783 [Mycena sp. CBHHK59/15]
MTEYDYSEEDFRRFQATQRRIVHWADDTGACAAQYKSPFAPRSDVAGNAFYNPQPAHPHSSTRMPQHSYSHGYGATPPPQEGREPRRATTLVSPRDSVSQAGALAPSSRHRRAASHSPPPRRHSSRSGRHRSGSGTPMYVLQSPTLQYAQQQYLPQQPLVQQRVPYVVVLRGMPVHIVYPDPQHPQSTQLIFVSQSGHSRRTRSANHSRSSSRSRR